MLSAQKASDYHPPALTPCREDARFLYKRTPDAAKAASPELQAAFALLQRLWCKDYQHVWAALQVRSRMSGGAVGGGRQGSAVFVSRRAELAFAVQQWRWHIGDEESSVCVLAWPGMPCRAQLSSALPRRCHALHIPAMPFHALSASLCARSCLLMPTMPSHARSETSLPYPAPPPPCSLVGASQCSRWQQR